MRRLNPSEWGGTETVVFKTSVELAKRGYEFKVLCPRINGIPDKSIIHGIPVERFKYFYPYLGLRREMRAMMDRDAGSFLSFNALWRLLREKPLDLIHCHSPSRLGGIALTAAKVRGVPFVITLHGGIADLPQHVIERHRSYTKGTLDWGKPFGMIFHARTVLSRASAVFCVGQKEYELMRQQHPDIRVEYMPNGVDILFFESGDGAAFRAKYKISPDDRVILNVGRIMKQKNQALLVEALAAILQREPRARLVLVGAVIDPEYFTNMMKRATELGVYQRLTVVQGLPPDSPLLAGAYAACEAFVLPSSYETFGIVVLEAWGARKPVLTSKVGGLVGFIEHEKDAIFVDPCDVAHLVEGINRLLGDTELSRRLADAGHEKAKSVYSWQRRADKVETVYNELIEASKK
jgi:glycosyltransferase involved in cell wall biosynthesis